MESPNYAKLTSMHFYGWKLGLKTGCYYLRTKAPVMAQKFTVDPRLLQGSTSRVEEVADDSESDSDSDSGHAEEKKEETPEEKKKREKAERLEQLTKAYYDSVAQAKAEAEAGTGCAMCSS
jgi:hypothetical protein